MTTQPEALRLADAIDLGKARSAIDCIDAAAELRRLHKINQELLEMLKDPRSRYGYGNEDADYRAAIAKAQGESK